MTHHCWWEIPSGFFLLESSKVHFWRFRCFLRKVRFFFSGKWTCFGLRCFLWPSLLICCGSPSSHARWGVHVSGLYWAAYQAWSRTVNACMNGSLKIYARVAARTKHASVPSLSWRESKGSWRSHATQRIWSIYWRPGSIITLRVPRGKLYFMICSGKGSSILMATPGCFRGRPPHWNLPPGRCVRPWLAGSVEPSSTGSAPFSGRLS